jgi:hypothetical protein
MPVGIEHLFIEDETRISSSLAQPRTISISIFYPASNEECLPPGRLVDFLEPSVDAALTYLLRGAKLEKAELREMIDSAKSIPIRAIPGLEVAKSKEPYPVLIYSPGGGAHRFTNVPLLEMLAEAGYFVVTMDHPFETPVVVLSQGSLCTEPPANDDFIELTLERIRDTEVVLDFLFDLAASEKFGGVLDLERIGMFGASRGGYVSILAQAQDPRIKAVGNMDGFLYAYWCKDGATGINRWPEETQRRLRASQTPVLRVCGHLAEEGIDAHFLKDSRDFAGDFYLVIMSGWSHGDFATSPLFSEIKDKAALPKFLQYPSREKRDELAQLLQEFFDFYFKQGIKKLLTENQASEPALFVRTKEAL